MDCCLNRRTYVTLTDGSDFWYYPTLMDRYIISGYRWDGDRWIKKGMDLRRIRWFNCFEETREEGN